MGVIAVTLLHWKKNDGSKHFVLLLAEEVFSFQQLENISVSHAQSFWPAFNPLTFFLTSVQIGHDMSYIQHSRDIAHCATYWDHPDLTWGRVSGLWASFMRVQILWGQLLSPESWYDQWSVAGCWGPSDERLRCHCDIPASQHLDSFLLCFLHPLLHPGSHTSLSGYRLNRSWSRDWKLGPCTYPRICSLKGSFELWSPL